MERQAGAHRFSNLPGSPVIGRARVRFEGKKRTVIDGPFAETKELIAGFRLWQVKSREEAIEWTRRFPNPAIDNGAGEIEVRQLFELEDFGESAAVERLRNLEVGRK